MVSQLSVLGEGQWHDGAEDGGAEGGMREWRHGGEPGAVARQMKTKRHGNKKRK